MNNLFLLVFKNEVLSLMYKKLSYLLLDMTDIKLNITTHRAKDT